MLPVALSIVCAVLCIAVFAVWRSKAATEDKLRHELAARATAEATLAGIEEEYTRLKGEVETQRKALAAAEKQEALALQKVETAEIRLREHEQLKAQFEQYAKSAALETGNQLSNKLLADHQRAREETHKQFEQFTKTASEQLLAKQQELATTMAALQGRVEQSGNQVNVLVRAMRNPIGAGAEGEIALDNLLRQLGLTPGQDYDLQVHLAGEESTLRPDGLIYLPGDQALIIDAKASQHIFELFEADGTPRFDEVWERVRTSMRQQVRGLMSKAYREEVSRMLKAKGRGNARVMLVMFIPNDEVVTRLRRHDGELNGLLAQSEILLAGPATLPSVLLYASTLIREARQQDEQQAILELTSELMGDLITALGYAEDVMKGVRSSATAYDKFAASLNRGVMARLKRLAAKGVRPAKNKQLPGNLPRYEITKQDEIISGEAEEVPTLVSLPKDAA